MLLQKIQAQQQLMQLMMLSLSVQNITPTINIPQNNLDFPKWENEGGVWYLSIQGGRVHCKRIAIPVRKGRYGHRMCGIILISLLIPDGTLNIQHD